MGLRTNLLDQTAFIIKRCEERIEMHRTKGKGSAYSEGAIDGYHDAMGFVKDEFAEELEAAADGEEVINLRGALSFYAAKENYDKTPFSTLLMDGGKKARQALGNE